MKELVVAGARIITTNEFAEVVLELAERLAQHGLTQRVEFPCVVDGAITSATLLLGDAHVLATVGIPGSEPGDLGTAAQLEDLHRRAAELAPV
ncbi:hypothetical protein ACFUTX_16460 [Microbacterium sp. NPDC057407]|uniref:hypothetical protein n=1 Tax=Microbacterium sp. NPDC057407 TaxID=3346120 RepID=UPI00366E47CD